MVWGLLRSSSASTTSTSASPALTAAAAPHRLDEVKQQAEPVVVKAAPKDTRPEHSESDEELDWELIEAAPAVHVVDKLSVDGEYLVVASTSGEASPGEVFRSEADMATPRQSSDEGQLKRQDTEASRELVASSKGSPASSCPTTPRPASNTAHTSVKAPSVDGNISSDDRQPPQAAEDDADSFRCKGCGVHVFMTHEIISSNYHVHTSPGYLLGRVQNISIADKMEQAKYTTGIYDIKEVTCERCSTVLGVTYCKSHNVEYRYKEGKFLIGSDRLQMPEGVFHPLDKNADKRP